MLNAVRRYIHREALLAHGDRVLVAVSGGVDSMTLLHLLCSLQAEFELCLHVAHLDHQLRPDSAADARFVEAHARRLGLPCSVEIQDVRALAQASKQSLEASGRQARYAFLQRLAHAHACAKIALGHQMDDQVETFFFNALRGAGLQGLGGMQPRRGLYIRPLLECSSDDVESYAAAQGVAFREDASNQDLRFRRNWLRLKIIPKLEQLYPRLADTLTRNQALLRQAADYVRQQTRQAFEACAVVKDMDQVSLDRAGFSALHPALQAGVLQKAMVQLTGSPGSLASRHVEALLRQASARQSGRLVELPKGWIAVFEPKAIRFCRSAAQLQAAPPTAITVPGTVRWGRWTIDAAICPALGLGCHDQATRERLSARMDWSTINPPLVVRARQAGDRIDPFGMNGHQKIQDILVDAKVPRLERNEVPIVSDQSGVLWVAGYRQSRRTKPTANSSQILELSAHRDG